ncbi:MAG: hypothetical protein EAX86_11430 [Candidatus Heimdallarchaeota archaeon]|nr:hypothetical protein [Candidatus Heimdallarchaeota archaeon]
MITYNLKNGQNTALRGLIAEEFARYILTNQFPILIFRPRLILDIIRKEGITGYLIDFLDKYQQTMDFFGISLVENNLELTSEEIITQFFWQKDGLTRFMYQEKRDRLRGFTIEVKSRTSSTAWAPFIYSFSPNQIKMFEQCKKLKIEVILCGVTLENEWNLSIVFSDQNHKILTPEFFF